MPFRAIYHDIESTRILLFTLAIFCMYTCIIHSFFVPTNVAKTAFFLALIRNLVFSCIITTLAMVITGATLLWLWGNELSIHVSWSGVDLTFLSDEEPAAKKKLMTEAQVLSFPEIRYTRNGGTCIPVDDDSSHDEENPSSGPLTCSICIEDFEEGELVRVTPCGHHYHTDCIMPWLTTRSADCPVCKESFVEDEGVKKE